MAADDSAVHLQFDGWEWTLYILAFGNMLEEVVRMIKTVGLATNIVQATGFWSVVNVLTDSILISAFVLRLIGVFSQSDVRLVLPLSAQGIRSLC